MKSKPGSMFESIKTHLTRLRNLLDSRSGDDAHSRQISRWVVAPILGIGILALFLVLASLLGIEIAERKSHRAGAAGTFFTVNGVELHVRLIGDPGHDPTGSPLLLIHGFTISGGHEYDRIIPALKDERRLIVPDLLGFGHSERLKQKDPRYSRQGQAELLAEIVRQSGVDRVDVVGTSYGGGVALYLALENPDLVRQLVLIDAQVEDLQSAEYRSLCELPLDLDRVILWNYQGSSPLSEAIALDECGEVGYCPTESELALRKEVARVEGTTQALTAFCSSQSELDIVTRLDEIGQPLLVIWGLEDEVLSGRQLDLLNQHAKITKQVLMPATGHAPHLGHPSRVAQILLDFLQAHE